MKVMEETKRVVGRLYAGEQKYFLLSMAPLRNYDLPANLREHVLVFYVVVDGYANHVIVSRGNFHIVPFLTDVDMDVKFLVETEGGEESIPIEDVLHIGESVNA